MADKAKFLSLILIALIVVSLGLAGVLFSSLQKEQSKAAVIQEELNAVKAAKMITESKLEESKNKISGLESKLEENNNQIGALNKELEEQKTEKEDALTQIRELKTDIEQRKALQSDLEAKFANAQDGVKKLENELKKLGAQKIELEAQIKELEIKSEYVELGKIVITPESSSLFGTSIPDTVEAEITPQPQAPVMAEASGIKPAAKANAETGKPKKTTVTSAMEAKVLVVNRDYNFVVINLGSKDGINVGNEFSLYHANKYIGDVKVEKVHDSMAAAGFVSNNIKEQISEGDKAVRKSK